MKKRLLSLVLVVCLMLCALPVSASAAAYEATCTQYADALYDLGLFRGTGTDANGDPIYSLEAKPTRIQALVILIRLLGEEQAALSYTGLNPFADMNSHWAASYAAYAYAKGYTTGTSATEFSPDTIASAQMFTTFLLRALGYSDKNGDFSYVYAENEAAWRGLCHYGEFSDGEFYRDDCVYTCVNALNTPLKGQDKTLLESLVEKGAVDSAAAKAFLGTKYGKDAFDHDFLDMLIGKSIDELKATFPDGYEEMPSFHYYDFTYKGYDVSAVMEGDTSICMRVIAPAELMLKNFRSNMSSEELFFLLGDANGVGEFAYGGCEVRTTCGEADVSASNYSGDWLVSYSLMERDTTDDWQLDIMGYRWYFESLLHYFVMEIEKASPEKIQASITLSQTGAPYRVCDTGSIILYSTDGGFTYTATDVEDSWGSLNDITVEFRNNCAVVSCDLTKAGEMANFCFVGTMAGYSSVDIYGGAFGGVPGDF